MTQQPIVNQIPALRRYARALTGDSWAADDLVQDTLERACTKWRLWTTGSDLRAWLFTVMHNVFVNQLVRGRRQASAGTVDIDEVAHELRAADTDPANSLDLQRCLLRLPQDQRAVLLLISMEGMSYVEAAKIIGIPIGTVMSRLSRARARLQELLDAPARPAGQQAPSGTLASPLRRLK